MMEVFHCGHPRTPENTYRHKSRTGIASRCRICRQAISRRAYQEVPKEIHALDRRIRNLPLSIERPRAKLARLEAEARTLGMHDILEKRA